MKPIVLIIISLTVSCDSSYHSTQETEKVSLMRTTYTFHHSYTKHVVQSCIVGYCTGYYSDLIFYYKLLICCDLAD